MIPQPRVQGLFRCWRSRWIHSIFALRRQELSSELNAFEADCSFPLCNEIFPRYPLANIDIPRQQTIGLQSRGEICILMEVPLLYLPHASYRGF